MLDWLSSNVTSLRECQAETGGEGGSSVSKHSLLAVRNPNLLDLIKAVQLFWIFLEVLMK